MLRSYVSFINGSRLHRAESTLSPLWVCVRCKKIPLKVIFKLLIVTRFCLGAFYNSTNRRTLAPSITKCPITALLVDITRTNDAAANLVLFFRMVAQLMHWV